MPGSVNYERMPLVQRSSLRRRLAGFTLVELLVVIAIIGVLVALLLPAVQAAREAARASQCKNNLRQLAIGILNYEASLTTLPPGGVTHGDCCGTPSKGSWPIYILPFIEQQALYDLYDFDDDNESLRDTDGDGLNNTVVRETDLQVHNCPSDEETDQLDRPASGPGSRASMYDRGSYRGNSGLATVESQSFWDSSSQQNEEFAGERGPLPGIGDLGNRWSLKKPTELSQITDGTSNTVLLGEKAHFANSNEARRRRTFWAYSYTSYNRSTTFLQSRSIINDYDRCRSIRGAFGDNPCKRSWGSLHAAGLNVAMCDGTVQFISEAIDIFVFAAMSTIANGETIGLESQ